MIFYAEVYPEKNVQSSSQIVVFDKPLTFLTFYLQENSQNITLIGATLEVSVY